MTITPRYLTGDKTALNEFIDRFDVRLIPSSANGCRLSICSRANLIFVSRYFYSTAMVCEPLSFQKRPHFELADPKKSNRKIQLSHGFVC